MTSVLLVEDDQAVRAALVRALTSLGYVVHPVGTALAALRSVVSDEPDVVILDLDLPDLDGDATLQMLRGITDIPVIIGTAHGDESSVVRLLNSGADDYLVKPFSSEHLAARITAVLRRAAKTPAAEEVLTVGELRVDLGQRSAWLAGKPLELTRREFDLLAYLAAQPGHVVSRNELIKGVWHQPYVGDDQTIDVHVSWLRRKLGETAARPRYLHTVRGVGLKLTAPE